MSGLINFFLQISQNLGYKGIVLLMTVESSFIPFPSELIIPPAAILASQGEMNIFLVILFGVIGSLIGAIINYFLAFYLGRAIIYQIADHRFLKVFLLNSAKVQKAEKFFLKYGNASTLIGRLVPVIRQLISLPAGFSKMNFKSFIWFTALGSAIWVTILAMLGYFFGANQELFLKYYREVFYLLIVITVFTILRKAQKRRSAKN